MGKVKIKTDRARAVENGEAPEAVDVREKFQDARDALKKVLIERDEEVDLVLCGLLCQQHVVLVGPPGTAKSSLLNGVASWYGGKTFSYLLTSFTGPDEIFGPVDIAAQVDEGKVRRLTEGHAADADFVFLDEIWKASSAILNTTLTLLNERTFRCGTQVFKAPLKVAVAASNEWPDDRKELGAVFDRFLFRKNVKCLSPGGRKELLKRISSGAKFTPKFQHTVTSDEMTQASREVAEMELTPEAKKALWAILEELSKEGIHPGDRRIGQAVGAVRAAAWLDGDAEVEPEHLEILSHVLWEEPQEQPKKTGEIVLRHANPGRAILMECLTQADEVTKGNPIEAVSKLKLIRRKIKSEVKDSRQKEAALSRLSGLIESLYKSVLETDDLDVDINGDIV